MMNEERICDGHEVGREFDYNEFFRLPKNTLVRLWSFREFLGETTAEQWIEIMNSQPPFDISKIEYWVPMSAPGKSPG